MRRLLPRNPTIIVVGAGMVILTLFGVLGSRLGAFPPLGQGRKLPLPDSKIVYIRSGMPNTDFLSSLSMRDTNGLYAVDVERDQIVGEPLDVGRADHAAQHSLAIAPNGKFYVLRDLMSSSPGRPYADNGLLILDPSRGWQRQEPPMPDDGAAVGISADGKAFIARRTVQPGWNLNLDIYDTNTGSHLKTENIVSLVWDILTDEDGLVYISRAIHSEAEPYMPASVKVIRSGDLETVANVEFPRYYLLQLALGPDGLLYGTVSRRLAAGQSEWLPNARLENTGMLVAIDLKEQRVLAEIEVPMGPYDLTITPEGKAYILHRDPTQGGQPSQVSVYDLKERKLLKVLPLGREGTFIAQVSPTKIYAATRGINEEKGRVSAIDTRTDTISNDFAVGDRPEAIALSPRR